MPDDLDTVPAGYSPLVVPPRVLMDPMCRDLLLLDVAMAVAHLLAQDNLAQGLQQNIKRDIDAALMSMRV